MTGDGLIYARTYLKKCYWEAIPLINNIVRKEIYSAVQSPQFQSIPSHGQTSRCCTIPVCSVPGSCVKREDEELLGHTAEE